MGFWYTLHQQFLFRNFFLRGLGESGVSSQGMWAKSLIPTYPPEVQQFAPEIQVGKEDDPASYWHQLAFGHFSTRRTVKKLRGPEKRIIEHERHEPPVGQLFEASDPFSTNVLGSKYPP